MFTYGTICDMLSAWAKIGTGRSLYSALAARKSGKFEAIFELASKDITRLFKSLEFKAVATRIGNETGVAGRAHTNVETSSGRQGAQKLYPSGEYATAPGK